MQTNFFEFFWEEWYLMTNYFEIFWGVYGTWWWITLNFFGTNYFELKKIWILHIMWKHSHVKMSKSQASWLLMRFIEILTWHNKIHTQWCKFWHHMAWPLKTFKKFIKYVFQHFCWSSYFVWKWTSLSVNLFVSSYSLHSDIFWHMTYSWYFLNIFWTSWHLLTS